MLRLMSNSEPNDGAASETVALYVRPIQPRKTLHYLTVVEGATFARAIPLTVEPLVLGRDSSRAFHLPDADVSRTHCSVRLEGDVVFVRDLGSTNGTFVDGVRLTDESALPIGSRLDLGRHALRHELLAVEEVARYEEFAKELRRARKYVEDMIPAPLERGPLRTEWCFVPSSVLGGDALGFHALDGGRLAVYVLDVCGHGVSSAMHSASVLNALRHQTLPNVDFAQPAQVLERLNEVFPMEGHSGMNFSIFYGVVDPSARRLSFSSAGHPPAIVLGVDGRVRDRLALKNPPIGTIDARTFGQADVAFDRGEQLFVFSDGAYEGLDRDGREGCIEDFERHLVGMATEQRRGATRRLYDAVRASIDAELLADDFSLLLVEHASPNDPTQETGAMEFEILEESPTHTQIALKGRMDGAGVDRVETSLNASVLRGGNVIFDLSGVTFLSSLGIRMLISIAKTLDRRGRRLVLVAPRPLIEQSLKHSSLDEIIPVAADMRDALAILKA